MYAHRRDSAWHVLADQAVRSLAEGAASWAIPWPSVHEFVSTVTNRRAFKSPSTLDQTFAQLRNWLASPKLRLIGEEPGHVDQIHQLMRAANLAGPAVHDARIAAICLLHGVHELWTADRDFSRFPALRTRNPLVS